MAQERARHMGINRTFQKEEPVMETEKEQPRASGGPRRGWSRRAWVRGRHTGTGGLVRGAEVPKWVPRGPQRASPGCSPPAHSPEGCPAPDSPPSSVQVEVPRYPPCTLLTSRAACLLHSAAGLLARQRVRRGLTPVLVLSPHRHPGICSVPTSVGSPTQRTAHPRPARSSPPPGTVRGSSP